MKKFATAMVAFLSLCLLILFIRFQGYAGEMVSYRFSFDDIKEGSIPEGWKIDATNPADLLATWKVVKDEMAPSKPHVLSITEIHDESVGVFNLCWTDKISFKDGILEVKVRANSGKEDQGGGLIWRVKDADNYYIARYNPLERNFRLYYVKGGSRRTLADARVDIKSDNWFTIKVSHQGEVITCWLDGQEYLHAKDKTFTDAGGVGLWTKSDAASSFDDLKAERY
ncbi:MAG TPA: family 16 glycoside hydrolase [Candidatus Brocadiia bacterium]|nr:DUF1080 domain-containing protein [Candidatus Brocadiales bacterium]